MPTLTETKEAAGVPDPEPPRAPWWHGLRTVILVTVAMFVLGAALSWLVFGLPRSGARQRVRSVAPIAANSYLAPGVLRPGTITIFRAEVYNPNYYPVRLVRTTVVGVDVVGGPAVSACRREDVVFTAPPGMAARLDAWEAVTLQAGTLTLAPTASARCAAAGFSIALSFAATDV
jgi:hypothetical protein